MGYTNAGKSTLLNALTGAGVLAEDKLFSTLDPTTRRCELPGGGQEVLFTDTVGEFFLSSAFFVLLKQGSEKMLSFTGRRRRKKNNKIKR